MVSEAPPFWWQEVDWRARALWPPSTIYGAVAQYRLRNAPRKNVDLPVLCVGNLTVGGTGKTPVAIAFAKAAQEKGMKPGFLSRGHGGSVSEPHPVYPDHDSAKFVGDEPLLLAEHAPVAVARDRFEGAKLLLGEGCDFLIMDDGFQSAHIAIDYALIVIDAERGIGNGCVIPAGPMRASLVEQMRHVSGVLRMGRGEGASQVVRNAARAGRAVFDARAVASPLPQIKGQKCLAFAGIGNPQKFFRTVSELGGFVEVARSFGDHHAYGDDDARELMQAADRQGLILVTTQKDAVRLRHASATQKALLDRLMTVDIDVAFDEHATPSIIIDATMASWRKRRLSAS